MENTEKTKKVWDFEGNETDKLEIIKHFEIAPQFRIFEFLGHFFLQMKYPNLQSKYDNLDDCLYYDNVKDSYMTDPKFKTLQEAQDAYIQYKKLPVIHTVINENN